MRRNRRSLMVVLLLVGAIAVSGGWAARHLVHDIVILDSRVLLDDQISAHPVHVAIRADTISYVGTNRPLAWKRVDGEGLLLSPGFLDTNSSGLQESRASGLRKLYDGVTTYLSAHGGLPGESVQTYGHQPVINFATTVGLAGLDSAQLGSVPHVLQRLRRGLASGAYGIALSPEYTPDLNPEVIETICRAVAHTSVPISFHTRYSDARNERLGLSEALACARVGADLHLLHLASTGGTYAPEEAVQRLAEAGRQGGRVTADFYPYTSWASGIHQARFQGPWRTRYGVGFDQLRMPGTRFALDAAGFKRLQMEGPNYVLSLDAIPEETVDFYALETSFFIGSDSPATRTNTHPRGTGSFARFLQHYVLTGDLPLAASLHRFSTKAFRHFDRYVPGMKRRGEVRVGYYADLILWDVARIRSHATMTDPLRRSSGVVAAFVNGQLLIEAGEPTEPARTPGRWLRGRSTVPPF